jgi:hypothetical protein
MRHKKRRRDVTSIDTPFKSENNLIIIKDLVFSRRYIQDIRLLFLLVRYPSNTLRIFS